MSLRAAFKCNQDQHDGLLLLTGRLVPRRVVSNTRSTTCCCSSRAYERFPRSPVVADVQCGRRPVPSSAATAPQLPPQNAPRNRSPKPITHTKIRRAPKDPIETIETRFRDATSGFDSHNNVATEGYANNQCEDWSPPFVRRLDDYVFGTWSR